MKNLESLTIDELIGFSLIECGKHSILKPSMKSLILNCCNNNNIYKKEDKLRVLRSIIVIIRFCNIHMYVCRTKETDYYSDKINKLLFKLSERVKDFSSKDKIYKIRRQMACCIVELEKIKLEEDVNKEFVYVKESMCEVESMTFDKKNLEEIDNYFTNELPSNKEDIFEFFNI